MDKQQLQQQMQVLQQQLARRHQQLAEGSGTLAGDFLSGKFTGAVELLDSLIKEEESDASKKEEEVKAN